MPSELLRVGGRLAAGFGAAGAAVVLAIGATLLPAPDTATGADGTVVEPVSVEQQRACPGPLLTTSDGGTALASFGFPTISAGTRTGPATLAALNSVDVPTARDGATPQAVVAPSAAEPTGLLAAAQAQSSFDDTAGLAAAACTEGAARSWILAGATDTGRTSLLLLANPTAVTAAVDVTIITGSGEVTAPGLTDIAVPAGTQRTLSLAGYALGHAQLAVGVTSRGGLVSATLQQTIVRGLEPGGVDLVGPTAPAATTQIIPGLRITTANAAAGRAQAGGSQDVQTVVRLLAPDARGVDEVDVTIGLAPEAGAGEGAVLDVHVHAGEVVDVPIDSLADGVYTATITASEPILASARASTVAPPLERDEDDDEDTRRDESDDAEQEVLDGGIGFDVVGPGTGPVSVVVGERIDLAWFVATGAITRPVAFTTVDAPGPRLAVVNPGDEPATVTIASVHGEGVYEVAPGSSIGVDLAGATVHVLTSTAPIEAAVSYAGDGQLASYPVRPANPLATPLTIYR
ncbi:MAG: hypothetical protein JWP66_257 [Naasia sp.]|nr:hypothetical protein [Naasia sp.]